MRKQQSDKHVRTLIKNGLETKHRSMFVVIGDKYHNQIVSINKILTKANVTYRPNVLWCYKDKLELSSHKEERDKQINELVRKRYLYPKHVDRLSHFLEGITYCQYEDSERLLGNTFTMCILQDFEALTPNLLARTIETVEGGGTIILLLRSLSSLTSLYTMVMDVHESFGTESHPVATPRFNERFLLSVASCKSCIVMDDEFNILPISSHINSLTPVQVKERPTEADRDLNDLKEQLKDDFPVGPLITMCSTLDQGKAVMKFLNEILDKPFHSTMALLGGRGRGKSAALGLAIAGAVAAGYSNIFVTAPSPENLKTLFKFVSKGFDMLKYEKPRDYDIVKSSNPELKNATIRLNIYKHHRQTIQYIQPHEHEKLSQVELLVIDEAAAIPLPAVKSLLGPYLILLSSTVSGYESTGRSVSSNLLELLKVQREISIKILDDRPAGHVFEKIELSEPIRYASGDPIELWLNNLLCLDVANSIHTVNRLPYPSECDLYFVNRDTLFSYHKDSELFLQRMMALYVASQYKNSPDDLQLLADNSAHHLFVLLGPVNESRNQLPDIVCVIQVCFEGNISKASVMKSLTAGHHPSGDQIPCKFYEQFHDEDFPSLSGARIVRIATHPDHDMKAGYDSAAIELLARYFKGQFAPISEVDVEHDQKTPHLKITEAAEKASLLEENIKPRSNLPPLLVHLSERPPEKLHYLGVSFGLTLDQFRFWRKHKFAPFYISDVPDTGAGEHTCMMLKPLETNDNEVTGSHELEVFGSFVQAFREGFTRRLSSPKFNSMDYELAMIILDPKLSFTDVEPSSTISYGIYDDIIKSPISIRRLKAYVNQDKYELITDLKLPLAFLYFQEKLPVTLSYNQASVLLCMGLQNQDVSYTARTNLGKEHQISLYFRKVMKRFYEYLDSVSTKQFNASLPPVKEMKLKPHSISVDEDLDEAAKKVKDDFKAKSDGLLNPDFLQRYAIADKDVDFESALQSGSILPSGVISVKSSKTKPEKYVKRKDKGEKKRSKDERSSKSSKKKRTS